MISEYNTVDFEFEKHVNLNVVGDVVFRDCQRLEKSDFTIKIVDSVNDYSELM